jgi:hypothetical protein
VLPDDQEPITVMRHKQEVSCPREHGNRPPIYDFGMAGLMLTYRANPAHLQEAARDQDSGTAQETTQETTQEQSQCFFRAARSSSLLAPQRAP